MVSGGEIRNNIAIKIRYMSKKFTLIYLSVAPLLFALSWFISSRVVPRAQALGSGKIQETEPAMSMVYASVFTGIYLLAYLALRDIYSKKTR